jgi:hypothetical protein
MKNTLIILFKKVLFYVANFSAANLFPQPIITSFSPLAAKAGAVV